MAQVPALAHLLQGSTGGDAGAAAGPAAPSAPQQQPPVDAPLCINVLTALTAAAQGGMEGAQAVLDAGGAAVADGACTL